MVKQNGMFFLLLLLSFSSTSIAETLSVNSLSKDEVKPLIIGKTIQVHPEIYDSNNKYTHKTVDIYFDANGKLKGETLSATVEGQPKNDEGTWTIKDDGSVCLTWNHWKAKPCLFFYPLKNHYLLISGQHGMALLPRDQIYQGNIEQQKPAETESTNSY